ncbi:MAG: DsrE/DsrF/DrsH-like family protein [Burkholderiales bacterium]|nr:DsrE/DsrF/DrsH-like family protein [Burkholderiales bacterium]
MIEPSSAVGSSADVQSSELHRHIAYRLEALEQEVARLSGRNGLTVCVFSGDLDRLIAAFSIANGAAACGLRVCMFFTFWGTTLLRRPRVASRGKRLVERMLGWLLPAGPHAVRLSRLDLGGLGRRMILAEMRRKGVPDLAALMEMAKNTGVEILACGMSMELMGIRAGELIDYPGLRVCGAAQFADMAAEGNVTLFV